MAQPRITAPLLIGALGALAIIIASAVAGWLVIDNLEAQNRSSGDAEILADIAAVNKLSGTLASAASVATNARMTPESIAEARTAIASNEAQLAERLSAWKGGAMTAGWSEYVNKSTYSLPTCRGLRMSGPLCWRPSLPENAVGSSFFFLPTRNCSRPSVPVWTTSSTT